MVSGNQHHVTHQLYFPAAHGPRWSLQSGRILQTLIDFVCVWRQGPPFSVRRVTVSVDCTQNGAADDRLMDTAQGQIHGGEGAEPAATVGLE